MLPSIFMKLKSVSVSKKIVPYQAYLGYIRKNGTHANMSVGFIGLGQMGSRMAKNLLSKFKNVVVFDVNKAASAILAEAGARAASDLSDLQNVDCLITMLPSGEQVFDVYGGSGNLLSLLRSGTLVIDCSTVDPEVPKKLATQAKERDISFLDAPVSGGVQVAEQAGLTFMVGGTPAEVERGTPLLMAMGRRVIGCGPTGSGQTAKLCNNLLLAGCMASTAEAMNLGIRLSLDPKVLATVINSSSGRCWASDTYNPVPGVIDGLPSSNGYKGGFASRLMMKDLNLAHLVANRSNTPIPIGKTSLHLYKSICDQEMADKDFSVIYQYLKSHVPSES